MGYWFYMLHAHLGSVRLLKTQHVQGQLIAANIYGLHDPQNKKRLYEELDHVKSTIAGTWIIFGDFNTVRKDCERFNSQFNPFIKKACLHEPRMGGHKFTYYSQSDVKMRKLDRYLVCNKFLSLFPSVSVTAAPWETSDHCPIILQTSKADFGKTPFRFFNSWLKRDGFEQIVKEAWEKFMGYGNPDAYLAAKFRFLKNEIKKWRAMDHPKETEELLKLKSKVQELDIAAENNPLSELELQERRLGVQMIVELEKLAVLDLKQKARI
uniref:Endonuclease/exonuclease/phosphatase domain-containing protein n=1 Tax=Lactuca sativa TaxID=4236 RepID=A0A9R1WBB0_LACSA|nr:hypothetical protein LSAT_V11C300135580 [Lactuca sativa]